jgi:hypothetical protein
MPAAGRLRASLFAAPRAEHRAGQTGNNNVGEIRAADQPRVYCGPGQTLNDEPT